MKLNSTSLSYIIARVRYQDGQGLGGQVTIPSSDNRSLEEDLILITVYRKLNLKRLKSKSRFIFGQAKSQSRYSSFDFCPKLVLQTAKYLKGSCRTNPFYITKILFCDKNNYQVS